MDTLAPSEILDVLAEPTGINNELVLTPTIGALLMYSPPKSLTLTEFPIETPVVDDIGIIVTPIPIEPVDVVDINWELYAGLVVVPNPTILAFTIPPSLVPSTTVLNELPIDTPLVSPTATTVAPILATAVTVTVVRLTFKIGKAKVANPTIAILVAIPLILKEFPIETFDVLPTAIIVDPILTDVEIEVVKIGSLNDVPTVLTPNPVITTSLKYVPILTKSPTAAPILEAIATTVLPIPEFSVT